MLVLILALTRVDDVKPLTERTQEKKNEHWPVFFDDQEI